MTDFNSIDRSNLKEGMLIFESLPKQGLGQVIADSTDSDILHVGILHKENDRWYVIESIGNRGILTPVDDFAKRSHGYEIWLKEIQGIKAEIDARRFTSKAVTLTKQQPEYDLWYQYNNGKLYCTELVALAAYAVGIDFFGIDIKTSWLDTSKESVKQYLMNVHGIGETTPWPDNWRIIPPTTLFYSNALKDPDFVSANGPSNKIVPNNALYDTLPGTTILEKFNYLDRQWGSLANKTYIETDGDRYHFFLYRGGIKYSLILFTQFDEERALAEMIKQRISH